MSIVEKLFSREKGSKRSSIMHPDIMVSRIYFSGSLNHGEAAVSRIAPIGCIAFSPTGGFLLSGSHFLSRWNTETLEKDTISFQRSTQIPITQVAVMTDEGKIIFSLSNGRVFLAHLHHNGGVGITRLGSHIESVSGLIRDTDNPNLGYSCGQDAFIKCFDIRSPHLTNLLECYRFENNPPLRLRLNGILQNPDDPMCITVCGNDPYVRVYDTRVLNGLDKVYLPRDLANGSTACIKGIAYSKMGQLLASYNNQKIYRFQQEMRLDPKSIRLPLHLNGVPICLSEARVYQGHTDDNQLDRHDITFFGSEDEYIA
ncbi:hypothetical protein SLEP1_g60205, partial [Rubroshorea leprosula]